MSNVAQRTKAKTRKVSSRSRKKPARGTSALDYRIAMMPFIGEPRDEKGKVVKGKGRDWWNVKETGDYEIDCLLGQALAERYLMYGKEPDGIPSGMLAWIVEDMVKRGADYAPHVRRGFFWRIGEVLPPGVHIPDEV